MLWTFHISTMVLSSLKTQVPVINIWKAFETTALETTGADTTAFETTAFETTGVEIDTH